ncbi:MAG: hypothetical protein GY820_44240 [Gammaproteobacteria bacterium]|nr:hypothetical protein [Gammaproteobacteria bacterium]
MNFSRCEQNRDLWGVHCHIFAIFAIDFWGKIINGEMVKMAKNVCHFPNDGENGEKSFCHFRHHGENGEKIHGKNCKNGEKGKKIDGENGENRWRKLRFFLPFHHGKNREKK